MTTFADLQLLTPIQEAVAHEKYTRPTPIQALTIPEALAGNDILGCAQTGTGKTAAFALPVLNHLAKNQRKALPGKPLALVLAPTRELAIQIGESFSAYGRRLKVAHALIYGGVSQLRQVQALERGVHLVVATPGRLLDLMQQGHVRLERMEIFVLDEADRMLDMGFLPDLKRIIAALPVRRQSLFFSATLPPAIVQLSKQLLRNPVSVSVSPESPTVELIDQNVMFVERRQKLAQLLHVLTSGQVGQTLVFTQTKRGANQLAQQLTRHGINALAIHGNKSQNARQRALEEFRSEKIEVLVATDLAARGLDIDGISHVINFELPKEPESYVHRIGRTGRAGETGTALSLVDSGERSYLQSIQRLIGRTISVVTPPTLSAPAAAARMPESSSRGSNRSSHQDHHRGGDQSQRSGAAGRPRSRRRSGRTAEQQPVTSQPAASGHASRTRSHLSTGKARGETSGEVSVGARRRPAVRQSQGSRENSQRNDRRDRRD